MARYITRMNGKEGGMLVEVDTVAGLSWPLGDDQTSPYARPMRETENPEAPGFTGSAMEIDPGKPKEQQTTTDATRTIIVKV